jgi:hypothetical protein
MMTEWLKGEGSEKETKFPNKKKITVTHSAKHNDGARYEYLSHSLRELGICHTHVYGERNLSYTLRERSICHAHQENEEFFTCTQFVTCSKICSYRSVTHTKREKDICHAH